MKNNPYHNSLLLRPLIDLYNSAGDSNEKALLCKICKQYMEYLLDYTEYQNDCCIDINEQIFRHPYDKCVWTFLGDYVNKLMHIIENENLSDTKVLSVLSVHIIDRYLLDKFDSENKIEFVIMDSFFNTFHSSDLCNKLLQDTYNSYIDEYRVLADNVVDKYNARLKQLGRTDFVDL